MSLNLNIYQTLAAAIVVYYVGVFLRVKISVLRKYCIPAPVVGGILFAIINCILYTQGIWKYEQDTIMQNICMMLFFTSIGYTASISLIKRGGVMVLKMAIVTTVLIICQNIIGSGLAMAFNLSPLLGLATGSIPMVGGHGTAAAFGPLLESIGLDGGVTIAVAAATFGLVAGGVIGGPIGEELVHKFHLVSSAESERFDPSFNAGTVSTLKAVAGNKERAENAIKIENKIGQTIDNYRFMNAMAHLFLAMGLGTLVSGFFSSIGLVFPGYIGSMIVAAIIRNIADFTHAYKIYQRESEVLGNLSLTVFLTCVLMSLKLWQLADLAIPPGRHAPQPGPVHGHLRLLHRLPRHGQGLRSSRHDQRRLRLRPRRYAERHRQHDSHDRTFRPGADGLLRHPPHRLAHHRPSQRIDHHRVHQHIPLGVRG